MRKHEGIEDHTIAIEINPKHSTAYFNRGYLIVWIQSGKITRGQILIEVNFIFFNLFGNAFDVYSYEILNLIPLKLENFFYLICYKALIKKTIENKLKKRSLVLKI